MANEISRFTITAPAEEAYLFEFKRDEGQSLSQWIKGIEDPPPVIKASWLFFLGDQQLAGHLVTVCDQDPDCAQRHQEELDALQALFPPV